MSARRYDARNGRSGARKPVAHHMSSAHQRSSDGQYAAAAAQVQHRAVLNIAKRVRGVQYRRRKMRA